MAKQSRKAADVAAHSSILGDTPVLTMQQRLEQEKQKKAAEKAAKKELARQMRAEAKTRATVGSDAKSMTVMIAVMVVLLVAAVLWMALGQNKSGMQAKEGMTYFMDNTLVAEMGEEGIQGVITEAYYTNNGGIYVNMNFSNAEPTSQHPTRIHLKLMNGEEQVIAEATVNDVRDDFYMVSGGHGTYGMFIPEKFVKIADDSLYEICYEITVDSEEYNSKK